MKNKIYKIISNVLDVKLSEVDDEVSIDTADNWDSLAHMNIIECIEEEFKISIEEDEMIEMVSVGNILKAIENRKL